MLLLMFSVAAILLLLTPKFRRRAIGQLMLVRLKTGVILRALLLRYSIQEAKFIE